MCQLGLLLPGRPVPHLTGHMASVPASHTFVRRSSGAWAVFFHVCLAQSLSLVGVCLAPTFWFPCPLAVTRSRSSLQGHRACLLLGQWGSLGSGLGRHHLHQGEEKPCRLVTEGCSRIYGSHWMAAPQGKQEGKVLEGNLAFPICYSTWGWLLILGY